VREVLAGGARGDGRPEAGDSTEHRLCGRLTGRRKHRDAVLLDLRDRSGAIQLRVPAAAGAGEVLDCDIGDIVTVSGRARVTGRGTVGFDVESGSLLAKAIRRPPKPSDLGAVHAGNRRELELLAREELRELFAVRAALISALRAGLARSDFIEVETPILQFLPGGALAQPFRSRYNALRREVSLRISMDLMLQRCVVGGLERVYELGKCFRNEGISRRHSPEFSLLEWATAYSDYREAAAFAEGLLAEAIRRALGTVRVAHGATEIDLEPPWRRVTLREAIRERVGVDILAADRDELLAALPGRPAEDLTWSSAVLALYAAHVEPTLVQPTIVYDFPLDVHPCMKRHPVQPRVGESFDIVIGGVEICSGGTALNDPEEQWERFAQQQRGDGGHEPQPHDREYVAALEYGMPPVAGGGLGLDRLLTILLDRDTILDVMLFPVSRA
jgi:lysyl-tRNA synthetase class 2